MIDVSELGPRIVVYFGEGTSLHLTEGTCLGFILAAIVAVLGIWLGSGLEKIPKGKQVIAETLVGFVYSFSENHLGKRYAEVFAPYIGSLLVWLVFANATGLLGFRPITADLNITAALATFSFLFIEISSLIVLGPRGRLEGLGDPFLFMVPLNLLSDIVLPVTLALRLFGNIFGGMIVVELWMLFMEWLSAMFCPVPILRCVTVLPLNMFFDVFEPLLQAYIFTMLTSIHLDEGISGQSPDTAEKRRLKREARKHRKGVEIKSA